MRRPWSSSWHWCSPGLSAGKQGLVQAPVCLLLLWQFLEIFFRGSWHVPEVESPCFQVPVIALLVAVSCSQPPG